MKEVHRVRCYYFVFWNIIFRRKIKPRTGSIAVSLVSSSRKIWKLSPVSHRVTWTRRSARTARIYECRRTFCAYDVIIAITRCTVAILIPTCIPTGDRRLERSESIRVRTSYYFDFILTRIALYTPRIPRVRLPTDGNVSSIKTYWT